MLSIRIGSAYAPDVGLYVTISIVRNKHVKGWTILVGGNKHAVARNKHVKGWTILVVRNKHVKDSLRFMAGYDIAA